MHRPGRGERVRPMCFHSIHRAMPPPIPPRTYPSTFTDPVYANVASTPEASQPDASAEGTQQQDCYRNDASDLNYGQIEFLKNPSGARRFVVKKDAAKSGTSETIYATVDATKTARLERAPQALADAREQLSNEIRRFVQAFATSKKARLLDKIRGDKSAYGSNAAALEMARDLSAERFTRCIESISKALIDLRRHTPQQADEFVGRMVYALTTEAIKGLTPDQKEVLARHMANPLLLDKAVADAEPERTSLAAATARDKVVKALIDAYASPRSEGGAVPVS